MGIRIFLTLIATALILGIGGVEKPAHAQAGLMCATITDNNPNTVRGPHHDINLIGNTCITSPNSLVQTFNGIINADTFGIGIYTNGRNNISIEHGDNISNVIAPGFVGTDPGVLNLGAGTAAATAASLNIFIQFNFGGQTFHFNVIKPAGQNSILGFTIQAGPAPDLTTERVISSFLLNRANHILANQPRIIGFVDGSNSGGGPLGTLSLNGNDDGMSLAFATSYSKIRANKASKRIARAFGEKDGEQTAISTYEQPSRIGTWDIWTEVHGARSSSGDSDSDFWVGYIGIHKFLSENMLIGLLGQFDWAEETNATVNSNAQGQGWMIGPYLAGQLPGQNLFYEARASWGRSNNTVSPIGTYRDDFDTTRWLASAKINGTYDLGDVTMRPELQISYFEETQEAYTDSLAAVIAAQTIALGELRFGPIFTRTIIAANGGTIQPMIGVSGVWNFGIRDNNASQAFTLGNDDLRARFDAGLTASNANGWTLTLAAYYDGLGADEYDAYGGSVRLAIPLN